MNENLIEIVVILDKSGSMETLANDTIGIYNSFIREQKEIHADTILTTVLFNNTYKLLHDRISIRDVKPITNKDYAAKGKKALLDAVGKTIKDIGFKLYNTPEADRPRNIIFFIITNGEEDISKEYSHEKIKGMAELQKKTYGWEFIFFGANIDSASFAASIGISKNTAFDIAADAEGIFCALEAMCAAISNLRKYKSVFAKEGEDFRKKIKKPKKKKHHAENNIVSAQENESNGGSGTAL